MRQFFIQLAIGALCVAPLLTLLLSIACAFILSGNISREEEYELYTQTLEKDKDGPALS